jgi:hypothetical protein
MGQGKGLGYAGRRTSVSSTHGVVLIDCTFDRLQRPLSRRSAEIANGIYR